MIILEILALIFALIVLLVVKLMPLILILMPVLCIIGLFSCIYYSKLPNLKMIADQEIPIEQVSFKPRNIFKELHEQQRL